MSFIRPDNRPDPSDRPVSNPSTRLRICVTKLIKRPGAAKTFDRNKDINTLMYKNKTDAKSVKVAYKSGSVHPKYGNIAGVKFWTIFDRLFKLFIKFMRNGMRRQASWFATGNTVDISSKARLGFWYRSLEMASQITLALLIIATLFLTRSVSATNVQLPAVYPLVNVLLPLLNNVYNLLLSLLSIFDTLPSSISSCIPVDLGALETSLLKLYSQALAIVNFLRSLPEYAAGANPNTPSTSMVNVQGLLGNLVSSITDLADDVLIGIGGGLLPGLLQLVLCAVQALLNLLL
ncbi:uncharacterized protein [Epargyreus clarus]|uniref:uncharacterized protein n=1 Tax=Epargyreus clarus TaxID=520877 RepID=UPI003C2AEF90